MKLCYIDESGGFEAEGSTPDATPLMVLLGLIVDHEQLRVLTHDSGRLPVPLVAS